MNDDPLSDEAFYPWFNSLGYEPQPLEVWQECRRRAKEDIADLETMVAHHKGASKQWREAYDKEKADNKQLRELLKKVCNEAEALIFATGDRSTWPHKVTICQYLGLVISEARAALEGRK